MEHHKSEEFFETEKPSIEHEPAKGIVWSDLTGLIPLFHACFERISTAQRKKQIERLLSAANWFEHYKDKATGRRVLSENSFMEYPHELKTAIFLAQVNYDVIFAPKSMFRREHKKFDIFLIRDNVILKADLKYITSQNPDTIAKRIKWSSEQASRLAVHIHSNISSKVLVNGLRSGMERNNLIREILLIYKGKFYRLSKSLILNESILDILQKKRGYT